MEKTEEIFKIAREIGKEFEADVIIYSGEIQRDAADEIITIARDSERKKNVILMIATHGGHADGAYRIARCLKRQYEKFTLFVDGVCKSAGTLIALGANELVLSDYAELGPLDVQLNKTDELWEMVSGLNTTQALQTLNTRTINMFTTSLISIRMGSEGGISTKLAAEIATNLTSGLYGQIYGQVDPTRLGEIERAVNIAYDYGQRLASSNLKKGTLDQLVTGYSSHGFVIDREEAKNLFNNVREPSDKEEELAMLLDHCLYKPTPDKPLVHKISIQPKNGDETNETTTNEGSGGGSPEATEPSDASDGVADKKSTNKTGGKEQVVSLKPK